MYGLHRSAIFTRFWWTFLLHCWIHSKVQYSRPCEEGPHQSRSCWKYQRIVVDITMKYTNKIEEPHVGLYPEILDWNKNDDTVRRDVVKKNLGKYLDFGRTLHWFWVYFYVFLDFIRGTDSFWGFELGHLPLNTLMTVRCSTMQYNIIV